MIKKFLCNPKVSAYSLQYENRISRVGNPMDQMFGICYLAEKKTILPLTTLSYDVTINEGFTSVEILQVFTNKFAEVVEFCYIFSINQAAAFCKLEVEIKNQKYYGVIKEKAVAQQEYQQGLKEGKTMIYSDVDDQFPDIMKVQIGNVEPNVEIQVKLSYIEPLQCNFSKLWRIHLPSTIVPRYSLLNQKQKNFFALKYNIGEVQPQILNRNINVRFNMQQNITYLKSPTHEFEMVKNSLKILKTDKQQKDFILLFSNDLINKPSATITHTNTDQMQHRKYCVTLNYIPNFVNINCDDAYREYQQNQFGDVVTQYIATQSQTKELQIKYCYVFLLDRSGSMYGVIESAIQSLILFLRSLPQNCLFNVLSFGTIFESVFPNAVEYSQKTLAEAINKVEMMSANLGGTEMLQPLAQIFNTIPKNVTANVFLITDGAVTPDPIIKLVSQKCVQQRNRCYTLGIGFGSSKYLIERVAYAGNGKYHYVDTNDDDLSTKIIDLLNDSMTPILENVQIKCSQEKQLEMIVPANIQQIRPNKQFFQQFLFSSDLEGKVEIDFEAYDRNTNQQIKYQISLNTKDSVENDAFHKLAAKLEIDYVTDAIINRKPDIAEILIKQKTINYKDLVDISVSNQVLSRATAFICEAADLPDELKQKVIQESVRNNIQNTQLRILGSASQCSKSAGCCDAGGSQNSYPKYQEKRQKPKVEKTELELILEYFNVDGSVRFDKNLFVLLKLEKIDTSKFRSDIWLCILVLAILQKDFAKRQNEWILIFAKGIMYLKSKGVDFYEEAQELVEIIEKREQ